MVLRRIIFYIYMFSYAILYSIIVFTKLLIDWIKRPSLSAWRLKERLPPKCITEPEVGTHGYVKAEGIKFHYVEAGDKSKPLMLFVHGFPEFWFSWRHQIKEFSKDYWTVAFDMRGYGDSDKPDSKKDYHMPILIDDIKNLVTALGREKFILVAHDWGGVIAWGFVDLYSHMLEKYIIMNAPSSATWRNMLKTDKTQFKRAWYVYFFQMPYLPEIYIRYDDFKFVEVVFQSGKTKLSEEEIEAYKYILGMPGALTAAVNYYRNLGKPFVTKQTLEVLPPGLFVYGENDVALSIDYVEIMPQHYNNLESRIIKDANHFVQQDAPEEVNKCMREFLSKK